MMIVGAGCGCAQKSPLKSMPSVVWKRIDRRCDAGGTGSGLGSVHVIFSASNWLCGRESSSTKCCAIMIKLLVAAMLVPAVLLDQSRVKKVSIVCLTILCYNVT